MGDPGEKVFPAEIDGPEQDEGAGEKRAQGFGQPLERTAPAGAGDIEQGREAHAAEGQAGPEQVVHQIRLPDALRMASQFAHDHRQEPGQDAGQARGRDSPAGVGQPCSVQGGMERIPNIHEFPSARGVAQQVASKIPLQRGMTDHQTVPVLGEAGIVIFGHPEPGRPAGQDQADHRPYDRADDGVFVRNQGKGNPGQNRLAADVQLPLQGGVNG